MKTFKLLFLLLTASFFAFAQTGNVSTFNLCSTCAIRQFLPGLSATPPQVQVWIYDPPSGDAAYFVTLTYQGQDGQTHVATQYVPGTGEANTVWQAMIDAVSIVSVQVQPMKFTGLSFQSPGN